MTLQEYDNLPNGTALYFVHIDKKNNKARIGYLPKSDYKNANKFCVRLSTTKQGAIENAVELYMQQIAYYTQAYKAVIQLKNAMKGE